MTLASQSIRCRAMVLDVAALPEGSTDRELTAAPEELGLETDVCTFAGEVKARLVAHKSQDEVIVEGEVTVSATATCVRCLEEFAIPVAEPFRVVVRMVPDAEIREDTGDDDYFLVPKSEPAWKSGELFRELILLAIPADPVCREDCAGLCAGCGRDLNTEECVCDDAPSDGPLGRLRGMLNGSPDGA